MKALLAKSLFYGFDVLAKESIHLLPTGKRPRKILFDHLPKCGGSSLTTFLKSNYPARVTFATNGADPLASIEEFRQLNESQRHKYDLVFGHLAHELIPLVHPDSIKVTVFREPVDRIISHYYYVRRNPGHYLHAAVRDQDISLTDYAASGLSVELRNWYTTHFTGMDKTQAEANPGASVARALETILANYDVVGFLDDFDAFTEKLQAKARLIRDPSIRKNNATISRPARKEIDTETLSVIRENNQLDVALYAQLKAAL